MLNYHFQRLQKQSENCQTQVWGCVGDNAYKFGSWRGPGSGPGTGPGPRQYGEELMSLLLPASVYKSPQTAAAPTLSSPCLMHRSEKTERKKEKKLKKKSTIQNVYCVFVASLASCCVAKWFTFWFTGMEQIQKNKTQHKTSCWSLC